MKQKRKVKSLIPQKKFTSKSLKTAWLVFLWSALYLASITLLSTSVAFWANEWAQAKDFEEFDWNSPITDKKEVVYAARFATIENLSNRIIDIFMNKDWVLYITPNPVIVNPLNEYTNDISTSKNEVEWVYGHILWWDNNKVYSNNVTIIAWDWNKVKTWSDNATMLWWENNTINQWNWVPSAIIWWSENEIKENHNWSNVIIWWHKNIIESEVSGSAILWWESNTIKNNTKNAIIWWSKVTNKRNNIFAYSTDNFDPENPNSFFLNMKKGVWINMEASGALNGLYVSGAVSLWDIDIKSKDCDSTHSDNYWLEWKYDWCLVGCTIDWWKMFDRGAKCEEICNENINIFKECPRDAAIPDSPDDYTAFCTGLAKTDNATQCPDLETQMQNYKNVVFETKLVDNGNCPESEDKCIFQCKPWFHLTGLITNDYNSSYEYKKCYEDCYYPWDTKKTWLQVPTNTIITWYNRDSVSCSSNEPDDRPEHDHCGNHKQTLICYSWQRYDYNKAQNTRSNIPNTTHKYETCETKKYDCLSSYYGLTKDYIINDLRENDNGKTWNTDDRSTTTLTRWKYKLCLDYDPQSDYDLECLERDNDNPHTKHYKFVGCNEPEYYEFTGEDWTMRCMKSCTFDTNSWPIRVKHNESTGLYLSDNTTCPDPCKKQTFRCDDGTWKNTDWADINDYKYTSCNLNSQVHDGYNISKNDFIRNKNNFTTYDHINISVKDWDIFSCKEEIRYKITWCADWYHLSPTLKYCIREATRGECGWLPDNYERTSQDQEPFHDVLLWDIDRSKGSTRWKNFRIWTWDNRQYEPDRDKCTKDCIEGYEKRNGQCVKDWECDLYNVNQCNDWGNYSHEYTSDWNHLWRCEWDWWKTAYCHICADGYSWEGTDNEYDSENKVDYCVPPEPDEDWECKNYDTSNESRADKDFDFIANELKCEHWTSEIAQWFIHNGYSWLCKKSGNGSDSELCHKCEPWYTWDPNEWDYGDCVEWNWDDGECIGDDCEWNWDNGECTGDDCEWTTEDEDWICNNKIKYGCNEWHTATGKSETKYSEKTIRYCDGLWNWKKSGECFICKDWFRLSGDICVQNQSNLKCWTASWQAYTDDWSKNIKGTVACSTWTLNGSVGTSSDGTKFTRTCKNEENKTVSCSAIRVACGTATGWNFKDEPKDNLCTNGNATFIDTSTIFKRKCQLGNASVENCQATKSNYNSCSACATVNHNEKLTCYQPKICEDTSTKSPSQTSTCNDWTRSPKFNNRYTSPNAILQASTCSSEYKLEECPPHWHCSSCTTYKQNWTKNECIIDTTKQKLDSCDPWYKLNNDKTACVEISYHCPAPSLQDKYKCVWDNWDIITVSWTHDKNEYMWFCNNTPCGVCDENSYLSGQKPASLHNGACVKRECNHCAKSGFPYCFPIDFSDACVE